MKRSDIGLQDLADYWLVPFAKQRKSQCSNWQWHLDEVFVKINGVQHYLWRAVDHEDEVLECYVSKRRNTKAAKKFILKSLRKHGWFSPFRRVRVILTTP